MLRWEGGVNANVRRTIATGVQVNNRPYPDIDHTKETLILLLELLLIENLHRKHAIFGNSPAQLQSVCSISCRNWCLGCKDAQIEAFVPVWIQGLLDHSRCLSLLSVHRDNSKWIRKTFCFHQLSLFQALHSTRLRRRSRL